MMNATVARGEELFAQGKVEEAKDIFAAAAQESPQDPDAWNDLGVVCQALGHTEEAIAHFHRAIEVNGDNMEARINLADMLFQTGHWDGAIDQYEAALRIEPDNTALIREAGKAYSAAGRVHEFQELLGRSKPLGLAKQLIDALWTNINYWELVEGLTLRERLEGAVAGVLSAIDGETKSNLPFKLVASDPESDEITVIEKLRDLFYYKQQAAPSVERIRKQTPDGPRIAFEWENNQDWDFLRLKLRRELLDEGGCLGDFTQTRKVLTREPRLQKYDLEETLEYFRETFGPCDCHVFRGIPV
jgi:tetratricopeptide (TPR) repeat protein